MNECSYPFTFVWSNNIPLFNKKNLINQKHMVRKHKHTASSQTLCFRAYLQEVSLTCLVSRSRDAGLVLQQNKEMRRIGWGKTV